MNEAENTMRALKDEPLLATSFLCRLGWHNWTKYGEPKARKEGVWTIDYQARHYGNCNVLNIKQLRRY
jgi:hypothetical protein